MQASEVAQLIEAALPGARALVESDALTPELTAFVTEQWQQQFGLIEVG